MRLDAHCDPITEDDSFIVQALDDAEVHPLLVAVAYTTGDLSLLEEEFRPDPTRVLEPGAGLEADVQTRARARAAEALGRHRDAGSPAPVGLGPDELRTLIAFLVGAEDLDRYLPLLEEELSLDGVDHRAPSWHKDDIASDRAFTVAVIGAGMSGIVIAHRLAQAGVDFVILEKNAEVGGTWLENTYPGCRVDVANHLYSYSFAQTGDWPGFFSTQDVLLDYFRSCVDRFGLRRHIRFEAEVISATFDEARGLWTVVTRNGQGLEEVMECQAVVSAVGQLNRPSFPTIPGQDRFTGRSFHSARWEDDVNLIGRRVAVIGTGASAAQFIPHVAEQADTTVVFQRTPPWLIPTPEYHAGPAPGLRWLLGRVPSYSSWDRLWLFWRTHEGLLPMVIVDSQWDDGGRSVSALNDVVRQLFTAHLESEFPDAELLKKVLPQYPPGAKRVVRDDGSYSAALARPDLELITESIDCITEGGVRTRDGVDHDVDVIIYGTGFQASHFLMPMTVTGLGGVDLHQRWDGEARAYLGLTVPGFPNFFMLYGPNTNIVINGSIVYFSECGAHFILECIRTLLESEHRTMECRKDVHDAYNERIDVSNKEMAWGASDVHSWYKNASGRVAQNWPFSLLEYWLQTNRPDPADFVFD